MSKMKAKKKEINGYHPYRTCAALVLLIVLGPAWCLSAASLTVGVNGASGEAMEDALVYARLLSDTARKQKETETTIVDQVDKEFIKQITVVQTGAKVYFPNHDKIRHHVYSFSPAKKFEIPLYKGMPANPIVFDKEGAVALGCNIHDWMNGYIYVVDTPYFITTGHDGKAILEVPPGDYDVRVWHPWLKGGSSQTGRHVTVKEGEGIETSFIVNLERGWNPRRGPITKLFSGGGYR